MKDTLQFRSIDLGTGADTCVAFMRDSFQQSFGDPQIWVNTFGRDGTAYREWLASYDGHMFHAILDGSIVGELMFDLEQAYLQHIYVIPEQRRKGLGRRLHHHFLAMLIEGGREIATLKVARGNQRAIDFYRCLKWVKLCADSKDPKLDVYQLKVNLNKIYP